MLLGRVWAGRCMTDGITGTLEDPIVVNSAGNEQYVGCTGCPADSHNVLWITVHQLFRTSKILGMLMMNS